MFKFALRKYSFLLTAGGTLSESALADEAGDIVFMQLLQSAEWKANFDQHVAPRLDDMRVSAQAVCDVTQRRVDKKLKGWFARLRDQETRLQAKYAKAYLLCAVIYLFLLVRNGSKRR